MHEIAPKPIDRERLPRHIGVIMDGNSRWAARHNTRISRGYREGLQAAKRIISTAADLGIPFISMYTLSSGDLHGNRIELSYLIGQLLDHVRSEPSFYEQHNLRILQSGDTRVLSTEVQKKLMIIQELTAAFNGTCVNLALNSAGRSEIVRAVNRWLDEQDGETDDVISEEILQKHLDLPGFPEPDLIIRSGGESRIGNFLLWESAYSEYVFLDKLWPDCTGDDLVGAIVEFQRRSRRFGGTQ
jgi:undecaprenyl diphosphate synthase